LTLLEAGLHRAATSSHERAWSAPGVRPTARIAGLTLADWEPSYTQAQVLDRLNLRDDEFAQRVFARAGVERRHLNLEDDFLAHNLQGRSERVEEELLAASIKAVDALGVDPAAIGAILSSSLYSYGCPSLAHRLIDHYGMPLGTDKYHVVGVGCASAVPLIRLATQLLPNAGLGRYVLVLAAESMSSLLTRAGEADPRAKTVGSAIFGDGCAAALIGGERASKGPAVLATQVHQIPGTHEAVRLSASDGDSYLHLARELPDLAAAGLEPLVENFLRANHLDPGRVAHWIVHPGGRRIVECIRDALHLSDDQVEASWRALAAHGNIGTASIFYVLHDTIARHKPAAGEHGLVVTIGPGVTVGLMLLQF
jgi:predicted naringenin-chalcone synthase